MKNELAHGPFDSPTEIPDLEGSKLQSALQTFISDDEETQGFAICTASPRTHPRSILGAQILGSCRVCGIGVWVSPSAVPLLNKLIFVCSICLEKKLRNSTELPQNLMDGTASPSEWLMYQELRDRIPKSKYLQERIEKMHPKGVVYDPEETA